MELEMNRFRALWLSTYDLRCQDDGDGQKYWGISDSVFAASDTFLCHFSAQYKTS